MAGLDAQLPDWFAALGASARVGEHMVDEHRQLQRLFEALLDSVRATDWAASNGLWAELERQYLAHIDHEEIGAVPYFEGKDAFEAAAILNEHRRLREQFAELGLLLDLHSIRDDHVQRLFDLHRHHAAREERILHQCEWADRSLPRETVRILLARISHQISSAFFL